MNHRLSDIEMQEKIMLNELSFSTGKNGLKIFAYNIVLCLINRYRPILKKDIFVVNGKAHKKFANLSGYKTIFYSITEKKLCNYIHLDTHVSNVKYIERVYAFFEALKCKSTMPFGYRFDFVLWKYFLKSMTGEKIVYSGHYDRLSTQISLLADSFGIKYCMKQHGLIKSGVYVPCKLKVSQATVFDRNELEKFRQNVILNDDCNYLIEYKSSVPFCHTDKEYFRVGMVEQPLKQTIEILQVANKYFAPNCVTVMMHPLSNTDYIEHEINGMNISYSKEKEMNYDVILALSSTLVYDYLRNGFEKPIILFDCLNLFEEIGYEYPNVCVCKSIEQFEKEVRIVSETHQIKD